MIRYSSELENIDTTVDVQLNENEIIIYSKNDPNFKKTWNIAYVSAIPSDIENTLFYSPEKSKITIQDKNVFDQFIIKYPFLKNNKKWDSSKSLVSASFIYIGLIIAAIIAVYFLVLPEIASFIASKIPIEQEIKIGNSLFEQTIHGYTIKKKETEIINKLLKNIDFNTPYPIKITVVESDQINAFALPGGNIVVFDTLLKTMERYEELVALLSHEVTHIHLRHSFKSLAREFSGRIFLYFFFGEGSYLLNISGELTGLSYSRSLESEADEHGFYLMKNNKIDPEGMISLFKKFKAEEKNGNIPGFLSTHPITDDRISNTQALIQKNPYEHFIHLDIKEDFEKIK